MTAGADNVRYADAPGVALDVVTGELVPARLTPQDAAEWARWVREVMAAALTEGVDYGTIPGCGPKPAMFKSGGEMLLKAAGLGFSMDRVDDDDSRAHEGVTYRATATRPNGTPVAVCEGYCGREEAGKLKANWNTIVKVAQKRALVGVALNATASSGLFVADIDDDEPAARPSTGTQLPPAKPYDPLVTLDDKGFLQRAIAELSPPGFDWFDGTQRADPMKLPLADAADFRRSHRDRLAWHILVAQQIKPPARPDGGVAA
jgi:hypothetical protein